LLERATLGLGGLVALGAVLPAVGAAVLPALLNQRRKAIDLGPLSDFAEGQFVVATYVSDPAMGEISRRTAYVRNNGFLGSARASRSCRAAARTSAVRRSRTGPCSARSAGL
jgi:hypothetical protein